jgi:hypothetical protein
MNVPNSCLPGCMCPPEDGHKHRNLQPGYYITHSHTNFSVFISHKLYQYSKEQNKGCFGVNLTTPLPLQVCRSHTDGMWLSNGNTNVCNEILKTLKQLLVNISKCHSRTLGLNIRISCPGTNTRIRAPPLPLKVRLLIFIHYALSLHHKYIKMQKCVTRKLKIRDLH